MSRDVTTDFKNSITAQNVKPLVLIEAFFDSETLRFWSGMGELTYDGDTYTGSGDLLKVSEIVETQKTEARGLVIELTGIPSALIAVALAEDYQDRTVTLKFATLDSNDTIIADPFMFFSGKADVMEIQEGRETATIRLSIESDLIALKRPQERRRTPEDQKRTYSGDTFFDNVAALQSKNIVWGKGR